MAEIEPRIRMPRETRAADSREAMMRTDVWRPAALLPKVSLGREWATRWVRKFSSGHDDPMNMNKRFREGWTPVKYDEAPELVPYVDQSAKQSGLIEIGGLVLCKMPAERLAVKAAYFKNKRDRQSESMEQDLLRENNRYRKMSFDNKTEVSFGKGG